MDRHDLYELCVQGPRFVAGFLRRVHGNEPTALREDFCGTAAVARRWIEDGARAGVRCTAVGVDLDAGALERAREHAVGAGYADRLTLVRGDALAQPVTRAEACDVVFLGNFSIGYIHRRAALVEYLRACRGRLALGRSGFGGGVMVCDTYDGPTAMAEGAVTRLHSSRGAEMIRYTWEQREADALTRMVTCAIHFQVEREGEVVERLTDAFTYRWRLWGIAELREAMAEAGFASTEVYQDVGEHAEPLTHGREMKESGIVCVVGRVD